MTFPAVCVAGSAVSGNSNHNAVGTLPRKVDVNTLVNRTTGETEQRTSEQTGAKQAGEDLSRRVSTSLISEVSSSLRIQLLRMKTSCSVWVGQGESGLQIAALTNGSKSSAQRSGRTRVWFPCEHNTSWVTSAKIAGVTCAKTHVHARTLPHKQHIMAITKKFTLYVLVHLDQGLRIGWNG